MEHLPRIALVGRPNVGKSALFNRICERRIAIVDEAEGITRDRLYAESEIFGRRFEVIDTGGIDPKSTAPFNELVKQQAEIAIEEADALILVVDSKIGMTKLDFEVARILQRTKKRLVVAVNKVDNTDQEILVHEFHGLGIPRMVPVSASQNTHLAELLEQALDGVEVDGDESTFSGPRVAVVGRPNVGKSTLVNSLLKEERCIVSPIAGTTRDSIDTQIEVGEESYTLIDTAGIRRKNSEHEVVDKFAAIRTERAIERADICLLLIDAQEGMTTQDKHIAREIELAGKACILLFNKWDLVKGFRMEHCMQQVRAEVNFIKHCPIMFMSASTGRNLDKIFAVIEQVREEGRKQISTSQLNRTIARAMQEVHPPMVTGKRARVYYVTQIKGTPPTMLLFVNYPDLMTDAYERYLYNQLRAAYKFTGWPLKLVLKGRMQSSKKPSPHAPSLEDLSEYDLREADESWEDAALSEPALDYGEAPLIDA